MCKKCILDLKRAQYRSGELYRSIEKNKDWHKNNYLRVKILGAKHRALRKGFEFELTIDNIEQKLIEQNYKCYFTGVQLTFNSHNPHSVSFDRLDNSIGYTLKNTVIVTTFVNISKSELSPQEFIEEIKLAYKGIIDRENS